MNFECKNVAGNNKQIIQGGERKKYILSGIILVLTKKWDKWKVWQSQIMQANLGEKIIFYNYYFL